MHNFFRIIRRIARKSKDLIHRKSPDEGKKNRGIIVRENLHEIVDALKRYVKRHP